MQLMINISEKIYKSVLKGDCGLDVVAEAYLSIRNGTPLPKGHEVLADSDKLIKEFDEYIEGLAELHDHRAVYGLELAKKIVENQS